MKHITLLAIVAFLTACAPSPQEIYRGNKMELAEPTQIGKLKDGRIVYHSAIRLQGVSETQHLFVAGADLTINRDESVYNPSTKTSHNEHTTTAFIGGDCKPDGDIVVINGVRMDPQEVEQALTRDEDVQRAKAIGQKLDWNTKQWKEQQKWKQ
jgi:hypothetical protein